MLQYTTVSIKLHQTTLSEKKQLFTVTDVRPCVSIHCLDLKQHSNPDFLTKSVNITLQRRDEIAREYLQAYIIGASVKNLLFCSLHQCKCARYTMLLFAFVLSNYHSQK